MTVRSLSVTDSPLSTAMPLAQVEPAVITVDVVPAPKIVRFFPAVSRHSDQVPAATLIVSPLDAVVMAAPIVVNGPAELTTRVAAKDGTASARRNRGSPGSRGLWRRWAGGEDRRAQRGFP